MTARQTRNSSAASCTAARYVCDPLPSPPATDFNVAAAILFILGLKKLGSPKTARNGNLLSSCGMFIAITVTLLDRQILDYKWILVGAVVGCAIFAVTRALE